MTDFRDIDPQFIAEFAALDARYAALERRTQNMLAESRFLGGLVTSRLDSEDVVEVTFNGTTEDGVIIEPGRTISFLLPNRFRRELFVMSDSRLDESSWAGSFISLGSLRPETTSLRGAAGVIPEILMPGLGVVVDRGATNFSNPDTFVYMPMCYGRIVLNEVELSNLQN